MILASFGEGFSPLPKTCWILSSAMTITAFSIGGPPVPSISLAPSITKNRLVCCARISHALPSNTENTATTTKSLNDDFIGVGTPIEDLASGIGIAHLLRRSRSRSPHKALAEHGEA